MTPHKFQGHEVAGQSVVVELDRVPRARRLDRLAGELQRTISMLVLANELRASLLEKKGLERDHLDAARARLVPWASRPLDLAFLRAALGPAWEVLDSTSSGPLQTKPSDMLTAAAKQATHTGWLGDTGRFDINEATNELHMGGRESAEFVLRQLYTADPDTRARLLMEIKQRGVLDALCSAVGWQDVKDLHDSLGGGFSEIKTDLQRYFIGDGKYGPSLGSEWVNHDRSLHSLVGRLGGAGKALNFALDVGTFGFNSSYGKAIDDRSEGITSEAESNRAQVNAMNRTAAIAAVAMMTGGMADKWVRGGAGAVSTLRAAGAGAAGGSVGAVTGLATSDAYSVYVSGEQEHFSSPEEYVKAALLGGAIGGVFGGVTQGLSNRAAGYIPKGSAETAGLGAGETAALEPRSSEAPTTNAAAQRGGRYGVAGDPTADVLKDPEPTPEVRALQEEAQRRYPTDESAQQDWIYKTLKTDSLRRSLLARRDADVGAVSKTLENFGVGQANPKNVGKVFDYVFNSSGIGFDYQNYAAWTRLASGRGTVGDVRFFVHEMSEFEQMAAAKVDYMGTGYKVGTPAHDAWFEGTFDPAYMKAHGRALYTEYEFLSGEVNRATGLRFSPEEIAAVDPTNPDAQNYMTLPDGEFLAKHPQYETWKTNGTKSIKLPEAVAEQLKVSSPATLADVVRALKLTPISDWESVGARR